MSTICFVLKPEFVLNCRNIFDGKVSAAIFERKYSIDIDDKHDFDLAKILLNKMTILFPLEIKNREFHSKIFLASKVINNTNFDLVIGEKNKVYNLF